MQPSLPVRMKARRNMLFIVLLVVLMTVAVLPSQAFAMVENDGGASAPACATTTSTQVDYTTGLPSGRWGSNVGSITSRIEPSSGILGFIANVPAMISHTTRDILPNMLMQITQLCWSCALSLSQFAASFTPLKTAGASVDHATANLIDSVMAGGIPAALMVTAIVVWLLAAGFDIGTTKEASKRLLATVLCLAALIVLGTGASKTAENATEPATGSPWWVVNTINGAVNKLTVGLDLDGLNDGESNMMAFSNKALNRNTTCQDYLYAMHQQYDTATSGNGGDTSSITKAVNRMWEETALRSWVTMQWGNPSAGPNTPSGVADNAQQAYCHVLDMNTNTDPAVQMTLTNAATGLSIDSSTAEWLFSEHGWIDPQDSSVNDKEKEQNDRDKYVRLTRAGIFWETCGIDGSGKVYGRDGWNILVKNMGDKDTGAIKNGKLTVRLKKDGFSDISGGNGAHFYGDDVKVDQNILQLCNVALGTKQFKGDQYQAFHNDNDFRDSSGNVQNTDIADAALTSNPITLPAGAVALGKLATNRDFWHGAKVGIGALGARAEKSRNEILSLGNRPTTVMTPIAPVEDNPFDLDESLNEMHSEDGSLNSDGDKAFGVVENSMMHNFRQQGHMSEQEAADALESARITGEVKEAAAKYHANLNAPKNPPRQKTSDEFETDGDAF